MTLRELASACAVAAALAACAPAVRTPAPPAPPASAPDWEQDNPVRPLPAPPLGVAAELTDLQPPVTPEKVRLGRWLFFDPRLSSDGTISCATCHRPEHGFSEPLPVSRGIHGLAGTRKAPPILNAAFPVYPVWFWDGRASSLAEQARGPMENPVEMGMALPKVVATVRAIPGYARHFREAFGDERVDIERISEAIAAYEATRLSGNSAHDRWDAGDPAALDARQRRGRALFSGKARCNECHLGFTLSDARFHNLGVGWKAPPPGVDPRKGFADPGRVAVSGRPEDTGAFKTPTLRDVSRRAPYMHDGSVPTLRAVVELYDRGGIANPWLSRDVKPLGLTPAEIDALVAYLGALDGEGFMDPGPRSFPR